MLKTKRNACDAAFKLKAIGLAIEKVVYFINQRGLFVNSFFFQFSGCGLYTGTLNRLKLTVLAPFVWSEKELWSHANFS